MRLRIVVEDDKETRLGEGYVDIDKRMSPWQLRDAGVTVVEQAVEWLQQQAERFGLPPNVSPQYTADRDGDGRQPPAVANVDRSTSAESKEAQS